MKVELSYVLTASEINQLGYPVVVEMWDKKNFGRGKRLFHKEFPTAAERERARYWHQRFYKWYLVDGTPQEFRIHSVRTLRFIERLIGFFGQL